MREATVTILKSVQSEERSLQPQELQLEAGKWRSWKQHPKSLGNWSTRGSWRSNLWKYLGMLINLRKLHPGALLIC
jgi:hypothetical protein